MYNNLLTDLDSLFDTRFAIAMGISKQDTLDSIATTNYYYRTYDSIGNIPPFVLHAFYNRRNKHILKYCKPTPIFKLLLDQYLDNRGEITQIEVRNKFKIIVNTYPYQLLESESIILLGQLARMFGTENIELVYLTKEEMDPDWIHENEIQTAFLYEGIAWLERQISNPKLATNPINKLMLVVPALVKYQSDDLPVDKEYFLMLKEKLKVFIDLIPIDVKYFCLTEIKDPEAMREERKNKKVRESS